MRKWYEMEACNQGPIIGGQVYLVRNIMGYPFEAKMNEEEQNALMAAVCYAVRQSEEVLQKKFVFINFSEVRDYEQQALIGKLAIPPQMFEKGHEAGILISEDESISVLVNTKFEKIQNLMFSSQSLDHINHCIIGSKPCQQQFYKKFKSASGNH